MRGIRRFRRAFAAFAALLALVPATAFAFTPSAGEGDALGAPPLVDMHGSAVGTTHGIVVVSFIYTRCPDPAMCPLVTAKFHRMAQLLANTPVRLVEVALDPAYDTPAVLRRYAAAVGADGRRWTLATGEPAALAAFAERMGLFVQRPRPGVVLHTEVAVIARDGIVSRSIGGNGWSAEEVVAEARAVAALPANPLQRLALRAFGGLAALCGAVGVRGITPAATVGVFLALLVLTSWYALRMLRRLLAGP